MESNPQLEAECNFIKSSLKNHGENLISFLLAKRERELQELRKVYKNIYNKELEDDINKELSGNYRRTIIDLIRRRAERDATYLYKSLKGPGTNEDTIIEIICTRSNVELIKIKEEFTAKYEGDSLEKWITKKTKGPFQSLLLALIECKRSENSIPDDNHCQELVKELFDEDNKKIKTNDEIIHKVFVKCSPPEIYNINKYYQTTYKRELREEIEKEFSSYMKDALTTILDGIISPSEYFARRINKSVKGLGTNDRMLIRVLTSRKGIDMPQMRTLYQHIFGKDMVEDIKDDTSGDYQTIVMALASGD